MAIGNLQFAIGDPALLVMVAIPRKWGVAVISLAGLGIDAFAHLSARGGFLDQLGPWFFFRGNERQ